MKMTIERKNFPLHSPFAITGYTFTNLNSVWVTLEDQGFFGRGEGVGIYYLGDDQDQMVKDLEAIKPAVEKGATRQEINSLMPTNGARNALDCAMWDLECKKSNGSIWELLGIEPKLLTTVATIGIGTPGQMAARALELSEFPNLKIKLSNEQPVAKLEAIRSARPDAKLVVDVNQGWNFEELNAFMPDLSELSIDMIEQPLARGEDQELAGFTSPIPIGADESALNLSEYQQAADRYQVVNIKLDKCGGLTEALEIARTATDAGKSLMVGNMTGTSLSMAPAYVIGQFCDFVDIDGPLLLATDIDPGLDYLDAGKVSIPTPEIWG